MQSGIINIAVLPGHEERAWHVAWNPTRPLLASCSSDKTVRLYHYTPAGHFRDAAAIATGHAKTVRGVAWAPSGKTFATASFDSNIGVWEEQAPDEEGGAPGEWECASLLEGHETECKSVAYSCTGTLLASCSRDKTVWVWEVHPDTDFECMGVLMTHTQDVKCVAWHPTEEILASGSYDDTIKLYVDDPSDDWYDFATLTGHTSTVWSLAFSPCGGYLASGSDDGTVRVWRRAEQYKWEAFAVLGGHERSIYSVSWGVGKGEGGLGWLASTGGDGKINVWDLRIAESGSLSTTLIASVDEAHGVSDVNCVAWCPRGGFEDLLASAGDDCTVRVWRVGAGEMSTPPELSHPDALSPDPSLDHTPPSSHDSPPEWLSSASYESFNFDPFQPHEQKDEKWNADLSQIDLGLSMGMDIDFALNSQGLFLDPNIFEPSAYHGSKDVQASSAHRPFTFATPPVHQLLDPGNHTGARRMSITSQSSQSSSSASGASMSPILDPVSPQHEPFNAEPHRMNDNLLMQELARRAREIIGVVLAQPPSETAQNPSPDENQRESSISVSVAAHSKQTFKSPPRFQSPVSLAQHNLHPQTQRRKSAQHPTPPSSTSSTPPPGDPNTDALPPQGKPKTSHTTIERRYRTNLNARIQSLRNAVPALRVLELKDGNRVGNLGLKAGTRKLGVDGLENVGDDEDVIDERGFVDGVKVARKGSKANVLGKAVEYIRVLKKRELRLKKEQEGLKSLVCELAMGRGPALLREWERGWRECYGGPETDEVEGEEREDDDGDEDEDDDDDDDSTGKKRKRAKIDGAAKVKKEPAPKKATGPAVGPNGEPMEKRKRGRPKKVLPNLAPAPTPALPLAPASQEHVMEQHPYSPMFPSHPHEQPQQAQPGQYLLAAFALFSFFNSPGSYLMRQQRSHEHAHTHAGSVLGVHPDATATHAPAYDDGSWVALPFGWRDLVGVAHLIVSVLLLCSIIAPWLPRAISARYASAVPKTLRPYLGVPALPELAHKKNDDMQDEDQDEDGRRHAALVGALQLRHSSVPAAHEARLLRDALGVQDGMWGLVAALARLGVNLTSGVPVALETRSLEQSAWMRLAELAALNPKSSMATRLQTYLCASKYVSPFVASASDLATLALLVNPFWSTKGAALWDLAKSRTSAAAGARAAVCKPFERYVLEKLSIDGGAETIRTIADGTTAAADTAGLRITTMAGTAQPSSAFSPLGVLASHLIRTFVRAHAEDAFLQSVLGEVRPPAAEEGKEQEMCATIGAGRSLDARTRALVDLLDTVCSPTRAHLAAPPPAPTSAAADSADADADLVALMHAIALYRRIFPSTLLHVSTTSDTAGACAAGAGGGGAAAASIAISLIPMPSPPPSPSRKNAALHLALRRALDSAAFDGGDALEDARDRVVDMLTSTEGAGWGAAKRQTF